MEQKVKAVQRFVWHTLSPTLKRLECETEAIIAIDKEKAWRKIAKFYRGKQYSLLLHGDDIDTSIMDDKSKLSREVVFYVNAHLQKKLAKHLKYWISLDLAFGFMIDNVPKETKESLVRRCPVANEVWKDLESNQRMGWYTEAKNIHDFFVFYVKCNGMLIPENKATDKLYKDMENKHVKNELVVEYRENCYVDARMKIISASNEALISSLRYEIFQICDKYEISDEPHYNEEDIREMKEFLEENFDDDGEYIG
jgi:hypothetical protein